ncbi:MAG: hypothetical protein C5S47_05860 [Candidatus Methanogasteraceae archaeon]|nr:MAG: hypothetical protein C5S47_05860 [ANME-2 cluster archaeon]
MADRPIEADCAPCPLTVGEWMAFLAAESQVKLGYVHLVVTVLLMFFPLVLSTVAIMLTVYVATDFKIFGDCVQWVLVLIFCAAFAALMYQAYRAKHRLLTVMDLFKAKDKNSEIIEEIIAGNLTDPDEIRKRWRDVGAPTNAEGRIESVSRQS